MNVVFLSPHFPPGFYLYCVRLREAGATVLGIADVPYESLRPELRGALTEYYRVADLADFDAVLRAVGHLTHRHGKIDRIDSLNEHWLDLEARLRTEFHVAGLQAADMARVRRKSAMKRVFEGAGIRVARGRVVSGASAARGAVAARAFVDEVGYPVIAKPDVGVGATRTYRLEHGDDLAAFLADRPAADYLLEEFLDGELLTYDGLVDRRGRVVFDASLVYGIPVLDAVRGADMTYWIERSIPSDLADAGRRILGAFGVRERLFHFELFRLPDGELAALEVNMRQPGGLTVDLWNWANDVDIYRAWADVLVTGTARIEPSRALYCLWAGRKTGRPYRLSHDEIGGRFGAMLIHHERVDDVFSAAIGNHGYVLRGPELGPLRAAGAEIQALAERPPVPDRPIDVAPR